MINDELMVYKRKILAIAMKLYDFFHPPLILIEDKSHCPDSYASSQSLGNNDFYGKNLELVS